MPLNTPLLSFRRVAVVSALSILSFGAVAQDVALSSDAVGNADNSSPWWTAFSDAVQIPSGKCLTFEFVNHTSKANNYNNFAYVAASAKYGDEGYKEYFCRRADNFGWGLEGSYDAANSWTDFFSSGVSGDFWTYFRENMEGAQVTLKIANYQGAVISGFSLTLADGRELRNAYTQMLDDASASVWAFLAVDGSHISGLKASLKNFAPSLNVSAAGSLWAAAGAAAVSVPPHFLRAYYQDADGVTLLPAQVSVPSEVSVSSGSFTVSDGAGNEAAGQIDVIKGCSTFGATDCSSAFLSVLSSGTQVKSGANVSVKCQLRSSGANNYNCPTLILKNKEGVEYASLRLDNYGWGNGFANAQKACDWDWDVFKDRLDGMTISTTITNNGDGTMSVAVSATDGAGVAHSQTFSGVSLSLDENGTLTSDFSDVYAHFTVEGCYVLLPPGSSTALGEAEADPLVVVVRGGALSVPGVESFEVYDVKGRRVSPWGLTRGLYVVRAGSLSRLVHLR